MAGEQDTTVEGTVEQEHAQDAQALAEFNAGFEPSPAPAPTATPALAAEGGETQTAQAQIEEQPAAAPAAEPAPAPAEPEFVQLTKAQFDELMSSANVAKDARAGLDKAFGSMGAMQQRLEQLQSHTQAGKPVEITEEDLADLTDEFPELASSPGMLKTFQKLAGKLKGTGGPDTAAIEKMVADRVAAGVLESRLEEVVDGDWRVETKKPEFIAWFTAQPKEVHELDTPVLSKGTLQIMRMWAMAKNAPPPPPPAPASPAPAPISARQRQLAAAVNPRSAGGAPAGKTAEDEFNEGFNS